MPPPEPTLTVDRAEFRRAIRLVTKSVTQKLPVEVRFDYQEGQLRLHGLGAETSLPANGHWEGSAFVSGRALKRISLRLPPPPALSLVVKEGKLYIEAFALPARWQDLGPLPVTLPDGVSGFDVMAADAAHPKAVIVSSGLERAVEAARAELEGRAAQAADVLSPYGVTVEDLRTLLQDKIVVRSKSIPPEPELPKEEKAVDADIEQEVRNFLSGKEPEMTLGDLNAVVLGGLNDLRHAGRLDQQTLEKWLDFLIRYPPW